MREIMIGNKNDKRNLTEEEMVTGEYRYGNYKKEFNELKLKRSSLFKSLGTDFTNDSTDFVRRLIEKYSYDDVRDCLFFHIIAQSSPPDEIYTRIDFPGDDSIEKFIETYNKFKEKNYENTK